MIARIEHELKCFETLKSSEKYVNSNSTIKGWIAGKEEKIQKHEW